MAAPINLLTKPSVSSAQTAIIINGIHTDIHCSVFTDYIYLIVTQFGKIGTLIQIKPETTIDETEGSTPPYATKVLFGVDQPLMHVMSKHIVSAFKPSLPVMLGLSLQDTSHETILSLQPAVQSCIVRAMGGNKHQVAIDS